VSGAVTRINLLVALSLSGRCAAPPDATVTHDERAALVEKCLAARAWTPRNDPAVRDDAIAACKAARLDLGPPAAEVDLVLGQLLYRAGRQEEAIAPLRDAVNAVHSTESYIALGDVLLATGMTPPDGALLSEAERSFRSATRQEPNNVRAHQGLAETLWTMGRYDGATEAFRTAARLDPADATKSWRLARRLNKLGRYQESLEMFDAAKLLDPTPAPDEMNAAVRAASEHGRRWVGWDDPTPPTW
jgi:tetratricopeptide (TPR) repeat protein